MICSFKIALCRPHTLKKLVPETCTCVGQSGTSFFSGKPTSFLHEIEHRLSGTRCDETPHRAHHTTSRCERTAGNDVSPLRQFASLDVFNLFCLFS